MQTRSKSQEELYNFLHSITEKAGNSALMSKGLMKTLSEKAMGNCRTLVQMSEALLIEGSKRESPQLDEQLFIDLFSIKANVKKRG